MEPMNQDSRKPSRRHYENLQQLELTSQRRAFCVNILSVLYLCQGVA